MRANGRCLTSIVDFPLGVLLHCLAKCILADELEVFRGSVHLCPFHICHNNKDIVAAVVVHAPQEHKFGKLDQVSAPTIATFDHATHHCEYYWHHGELSVLHRAMVINVRGPRTVEGYEPCGVHGAHKDVLRHEVAFTPSKHLFSSLQGMQRGVPALADMHEPVPVRVIAMLEPFVDEHVGRVVVKCFADEFAHGEAWGLYWGVKTGFFGGHCREVELCGCGNQAKGEVTSLVRVPDKIAAQATTSFQPSPSDRRTTPAVVSRSKIVLRRR
jgi:hypothetical protein